MWHTTTSLTCSPTHNPYPTLETSNSPFCYSACHPDLSLEPSSQREGLDPPRNPVGQWNPGSGLLARQDQDSKCESEVQTSAYCYSDLEGALRLPYSQSFSLPTVTRLCKSPLHLKLYGCRVKIRVPQCSVLLFAPGVRNANLPLPRGGGFGVSWHPQQRATWPFCSPPTTSRSEPGFCFLKQQPCPGL